MLKVVLEEPRMVRVADTSPPAREGQDALVRLLIGGVCGSDLSAYRGTSPMIRYPRVLGHEIVVEVLHSPERPEMEGARAVIDPMIPCRACRACRAGRYNCCAGLRVMGVHVDGGLQEEMWIDACQLVSVPPGLPDETAALAEPLTIAYHAVARANVQAGETAVVFGAGTIGLLIAELLIHARGCRVLAVDIEPRRLALAQERGSIPAPAEEQALVELVHAETGNRLADVVFEASGNDTATRAATAVVGHAGRIVLIGWNRGPVQVNTVTLMRKEADVFPSRNSLNAFPPVLQLLARGVIDPRFLVTHRFPLAEAGAAFDLLDRDPGMVLKVLLEAS